MRHALFTIVCELLEHRMSDNGFKYVKCPEYPCVFIANHKEVLNYLQAVDQQRYDHLVINIGKEHSKWPKTLCYCYNTYSLKHSKTINNPGRMYFSCRSRTCSYFQWLDAPWNHKILVFTLVKLNPPSQQPRYPGFQPRMVAYNQRRSRP